MADSKAKDGKAEYVQSTELLQLVSFRLGNEEFGVNILQVREINRLMEVTKVPQAPDYVEGIVNLRGSVIPVVSLRNRFGLEKRENDSNARIIVVDLGGRVIGFTVDSVDEVLRIETSIIEPAPDIVAGIQKAYISGVAKLEERLLIFLDLERVLSGKEVKALEKAA